MNILLTGTEKQITTCINFFIKFKFGYFLNNFLGLTFTFRQFFNSIQK